MFSGVELLSRDLYKFIVRYYPTNNVKRHLKKKTELWRSKLKLSDYIRRNAFTTKKNKRRLRGSECNNSKVNLTVGVLIRFVGGKKHHLALTHNRLLTNTAASDIKQTKVLPASENSLSSQKSNPGHINSKKVTLENITR